MMTTTTSPVTVVCSGASLITKMDMLAPTSVGQITLDQQDVVLPPQFILRDTVRGFVGLMHVPQKQTQSQMPSEAYANYSMGPPLLSFSFRFQPPTDSYVMCLVSGMVFVFCFQVPKWLPCTPMGPQPLGFVTLQPFRVHPWQTFVAPGDGQWTMAVVH